jgi:hypothetical protein
MLSVIILNVVILSVVILSVTVLNVVAPFQGKTENTLIDFFLRFS